MSRTECLTSDRLNSFLAGQIASDEWEGIEFHLSHCPVCRRRLVSLYEDSKTASLTHRAPYWLKAKALKMPYNRRAILASLILGFRRRAAAVAAAVLVVLGLASWIFLIEPGRVRQRPTPDALRQETRISPAQLLAPSAGAVITSEQIEFRWSETQGANRYTFTLLDEKGDIVFQASTTEKRLALNVSSVPVARGRPYFWYVGAKWPDGSAVDSEIRKFVL